MCRLLGIAGPEPVSAEDLLLAAPCSLRSLAREHADGWGLACHDGARWQLERSPGCAADSERFAAAATQRGRVVVAHIRKATVGATALANTHPFRRDDFVFAHNGTLPDVSALVAATAPAELARVEGATDSERLFAFVLTHVAAAPTVQAGLERATAALRALGPIGSTTFLFASGNRLWAHRSGRELYMASRGAHVAVASQPLTGEPWRELGDGELLALDAEAPTPLRLAA